MQINWRGKRIRTLALFCCLPFSGYLRADISDYTVAGATLQDGYFGSIPATIPQFNPALGSLNSVSFNLFVTFNGSVTYLNNSDTPGEYYIDLQQQIEDSLTALT